MRPEPRINLLVFLLLSTLLITATQIVIPPASRAENAPAVRHKQLAALISNELNLRKDSRAGYKPSVHWVHLNRDAFVDAIVILKQHDSSCALQSTCLGFVVQGGADGFHMISSFPANHHPLYLAPLTGNTSPRTLYHSEDGDDYDEIVFSNNRYQVARQGLSVGRVREQAYRSISEEQFDDLATQTADVEKIGSSPAGAPAIVRLLDPPTSLSNGNELLQVGYATAASLEKHIRQHFSALARQILLSHTVTIDLVPCKDWMTRVPLVNQRDRSSNRVVGCLELLGIFTANKIDLQTQYESFLYLLSGAFGQALAVQTSALEGVLRQVRRSSQLAPQNRNELEAALTRSPWNIFYLLGSTVAERAGYSIQHGAPFLYWQVIDMPKIKTRGEYPALLWDFQSRYTATLCTKDFLNGSGNQFYNNSLKEYREFYSKEFENLNEQQVKVQFQRDFMDWAMLGEGLNTCKTLSGLLNNHAQY